MVTGVFGSNQLKALPRANEKVAFIWPQRWTSGCDLPANFLWGWSSTTCVSDTGGYSPSHTVALSMLPATSVTLIARLLWGLQTMKHDVCGRLFVEPVAHYLVNVQQVCSLTGSRVRSVWLGPGEAAWTSHHPQTRHTKRSTDVRKDYPSAQKDRYFQRLCCYLRVTKNPLQIHPSKSKTKKCALK